MVKTWTLADPLFITDVDLKRIVKYPPILLLVFFLAFLKHTVNEKYDLYADVSEKKKMLVNRELRALQLNFPNCFSP